MQYGYQRDEEATMTETTINMATGQSVSINSVRSEALFVSALQRSEAPTAGEVRAAITGAVREFGRRGCVERVAQEFGDHPETAVIRMRWARDTVDGVFPRRSTVDRFAAVPAQSLRIDPIAA
jgi:hypothetical protein